MVGVYPFREISSGIEWRHDGRLLRVETWGPDAVRVRAAPGALPDDQPGALGATAPEGPAPEVALPAPGAVERTFLGGLGVNGALRGPAARLRHGAVTVEITPDGVLRFLGAEERELLAEEPAHFWWPGPRPFTPRGDGGHRAEQHFRAYEGERLYGLGQHQHGLLDQKGAVLDLRQRNGEVTVPLLLSSRGYGLLWNNPAVGTVELGVNRTRWTAERTRSIDYWFTAGTPAEVLSRYADATGHAPVLPEWATGFWQSKLRYRSQAELLDVARAYHRRGLPLSVIVADFYHWTSLGGWAFDPEEWPDPKAMAAELHGMGTRLVVSVWPSVNPASPRWAEMRERGLLVGTTDPAGTHTRWVDKPSDEPVGVSFYDPTSPEARAYLWQALDEGYRTHGVDAFWLDADEPEIAPVDVDALRFHAGPGAEVANLYPREHARAVWEGVRASGEETTVSLSRSAWAGSQRYGTALWSGDIGVDFPTLRRQIAAGLNAGLSGIPWWCSDTGGFHGGDPDDPAYREVMIRWFQFGALSPLFRLHGDREPRKPLGRAITGGPNEVWSYGSWAYGILTSFLALRERLRPYLNRVMREAAERGLPAMRALFLEFPGDPAAWVADDTYLLGPDLLVAPVTGAGVRERDVYLPAGARWRDAWTGRDLEAGRTHRVAAPLDLLPLFVRDGAELPVAPQALG
ncbi:TIM-barrel domain-containing protein [Streptomyces sp. NPDC060243]|uniref:glycoside hydrolase family 31 protein n=1 Tax=Streptomyces sp. NPDC060243 TaxID=3347081 RepID=UPI003664254F